MRIQLRIASKAIEVLRPLQCNSSFILPPEYVAEL